MTPTIIFDRVGKRFSRSYVSDSLRDAFTLPFRRLFNRNGRPKSKDEFWALDDVSFEVRPGEAVGIIGCNGSGKSTTLKLLSRILKPDEGNITVRGRVGALIELGAGFHPDLTGRENVFLNASILGMGREEINRKYDEIVDFAELYEFMDTPVKWYSSGMYARLGFAVATHMNPDVLLVDEVLSVGDIGFQKKCMDRMISYKENGIIIVFVSHNMTAISTLCNRVIVLEHGKVVSIGSPHESILYYTRRALGGNADSNKISLLEGEIYDDRGQKRYSFECGEKAKLKIKVKTREALSNVSVGLRFTTTEGVLVAKIQTDTLSNEVSYLRKDKLFSFEVGATLNLAPGEYDCFAYIFDKKIKKIICSTRFTQIIINGYSQGLGVAYLKPKLINISEV